MTARLGYSVAEAARLLSVSTKTIRRMVADGRLEHIRIGTRVIVMASSLTALLDAAR